ncbi:uroporphyrin-III C-m [Linnemannia elongata AG-77]|uniref:precorrin-2 dehydrogenase n=1 Tax=Linnemannia elongata AG-77 TaxID=1314771 RepID=A0A197KGB4_9FUNG|nr:uroporphyrin-III C-m [Linnemannia elongata AG-77]
MVRSAIDPIRPGASLILAWQIKHKHVVIIGGGFVAAGRLVNVLEADAKVTVICPDNEELSETVRQHLDDHPQTTRLVPREFQDTDLTTPFGEHMFTKESPKALSTFTLEGYPTATSAATSAVVPPSISSNSSVSTAQASPALSAASTTTSLESALSLDEPLDDIVSAPAVDMVLSAIDDIPLSTHIYNLCKRLRIPVNIADVPPQCDFYFCSTHRDKSLQVAVSTSGKGPKLANLVRRHIADHLPNRVGEAIEQVGILRAKLRKMAPGPEVGPKRMGWMSRVCEQWRMEDLATLEEKSMQIVLSGFKDNVVYSYDQVQAKIAGEESTEAETEKIESKVTIAAADLTAEHTITKDTPAQKTPRLVLVGAGPGDPELLTLKAARLLEEADLVVADRLIPMEVIDLAKGEVRIAPKKRTVLTVEQKSSTADQETLSTAITSDNIQDQLNEWCLQGLREGKTVVRLKQGDPFIFGRGAEEILFFREHGFDAEVVPGISSALSAPLSANVPLTHRGSANQVVITTAQIKGGRLSDNFPVYDAQKTVVVLMGVGKAKEISEMMQTDLGWPANVPVVIVENAHCANERALDATLSTLAQVVEEQKAIPPSVFVIGWAGSVLRQA